MDYDDPFDSLHAHCRKNQLEYIRARNDFKDHESSYAAYEDAQGQTRTMKAHLEKVEHLVGAEGGQLQIHLKALQDALASQTSLLDKLVKSVPPMARRPPGTNELVERVFSIPELLERILVCLSAGDLFQAMRVNHQFFDAIEASPRIQMRMGLRAQENCHIRLPVAALDLYAICLSIENYYGYTNQRHEIADNEVTMRADVYTSERNPLPKPGKRCRQVLIAQPPIKSMKIYTRCCSPSWPFRTTSRHVDVLAVETGITIGDMLDAYTKIAEEHKLCPDATPDLHDENGFVVPRISFETNVATLEDDPKLLARRRLDDRRKAEDERWRLREQRMTPYIAAKRSARDNGEPIPTLAEFEKARDERADGTASAVLPLP